MTSRPRLILGIDPGFGRMGFGCVEAEGARVRAVDFGVVTTAAGTPFPERLRQLADDLDLLVRDCRPDLIALETLFFSKNSTTAMRVAEARGVALLTAARAGVPVAEVGPSQVKKALTGDGSAAKPAMQRMVARLLGLPRVPTPDDAADALAIALTVSSMRR